MKKVIIKNTEISYIIRRTTKSKIYIRVKDNVVIVSVTKTTPIKEVESLLEKHYYFILENIINNQKQQIIHVNGIGYIPKFILGNKNSVSIIGNEIHITTKKLEYELQKKTLHDFYKKELENELCKIMYDAMKDFNEFAFPSIRVSYMKSMFGNYNKRYHRIKLSSLLAKYDYKFIKHVLYHELSHVEVLNHSKEFFSYFESKYPNAKLVRKELKKIKYNDYI